MDKANLPPLRDIPKLFPSQGRGPDYPILMVAIVVIMVLGFLSSLFPMVEAVITTLLIGLGIVGTIAALAWYLRERRLDWEAFHGPLPIEEEKENR